MKQDDKFYSTQSMSLMIPSDMKIPLRVSFSVSFFISSVPCCKCGVAIRRQYLYSSSPYCFLSLGSGIPHCVRQIRRRDPLSRKTLHTPESDGRSGSASSQTTSVQRTRFPASGRSTQNRMTLWQIIRSKTYSKLRP